MSLQEDLIKWVESHPIILIKLESADADHIQETGKDKFTIAKKHGVFEKIKIPALCIVTLENESLQIAVIKNKAAVSTFETRITIVKMRALDSESLETISGEIKDRRILSFYNRMEWIDDFLAVLTPKLSVEFLRILLASANNHQALEIAASQISKLFPTPRRQWEQEDAVNIALESFGINDRCGPPEILIKSNSRSTLANYGKYLFEDNVVHADASHLPGFDIIASDVTGRAIFTKADERLIVYTANKLPLEEMLGVDLIYINEIRGNIIMVQYKMLEEVESQDTAADWIFRLDEQVHKEVKRMKLPPVKDTITDYRLNANPFYFKFVQRKTLDDKPKSFLISLDHFEYLRSSPDVKGPKGGIRISYNTLAGTYLRAKDIIRLIRSGYIGTHSSQTKALAPIIESVSKGNRALVLAWQQKNEIGENESN